MSIKEMFIENYCAISADKISFTRQQGSDFAKQVADDFNPLHNIDAKRFCVPGDLLFSIIIAKSGLHKKMTFDFSGMVNDNVSLTFPQKIDKQYDIKDDKDKTCLSVSASGESTHNPELINALTKAYVDFSGHTFPDILVKLMSENNVMINPSRPMVMYQSMSIDLHTLDAKSVTLKLSQTSLTIEGKRGDAWLEFDLLSNGEVIGHGKKHMLLSGLRPYEQEVIDAMVNQYHESKASYQG
ncbi:DUF3581 family protein [Colwellia psychrerythraea]|uniref:DUF3581 domain-containing protein n=1 Tax=Colwellia psychrerythraea TaxID=28229 RepID=A0A099KL64_COLPS|nr:DUF3581 family protein [Colwellia psychrerythraea]KGJ91151.1 Protein of unknown function DUF3581 [Colwellia psychrerythraea]